VYGLRTVVPVLLLAAVVAGAVAMWSDTLKINAAIETGEVKVKFSDWYCSDQGPDEQLPGFSNSEGKDVASCSVDVEEKDIYSNPIKLKVEIKNTYPGYTANVSILVDNIGTIPVKLFSIFICYERLPVLVSLILPEDTQIDPGMNKTFILRELSRSLGISGGGHPQAAGARVRKDLLKTFLEELSKSLD